MPTDNQTFLVSQDKQDQEANFYGESLKKLGLGESQTFNYEVTVVSA